MVVRDAMSRAVLTVGPDHSVADAAQLMVARHVGAAVVIDQDLPGPGIITERDVLRLVARGGDTAATSVRDCMTFDARTASASWDLDRAAREMVDRGFRHLIVHDDAGEVAGVLSMRDIVRARARGEAPAAR